MTNKSITLTNEDGLHARAAALFVREANKFSSEISLEAHEEKVNGKSIIGIMSLGAFKGEKVTIYADGSNEKEAVDTLYKLIGNEFAKI